MIELVLCTLIWGASFIAQKLGADHFGPFSINCYRNLLAAAFLGGCILLRDRFAGRVRREVGATRIHSGWTRATAVGGTLSGVCLFAAMLTQQLGIERTTPGVSAFLTANYVLLVPVFGIFLGRRAGLPVWAGVALAVLGTFLICFSMEDLRRESLDLGTGEAWTLLCAALFAVQILVVDHYAARHAGRCDVLRFSMVQVVTAGLCSAPFMLLGSERAFLTAANLKAGVLPVLYLGIMSSGIAYTLQNLGQARTAPAVASIIMSFESVVGAVSGYLYFGDVLSAAQIAGCGLVFAAILLSQRQGR